MAVTWTITETFRSSFYGGKTDVIRLMSWWAHCENTVNAKTGMADKTGQVMLDASVLTNFIPYKDVTEAKALQWLFKTLGPDKQKIETNLEMQVEFCLYPQRTGGLPWSGETNKGYYLPQDSQQYDA